MSFFQKQTVEWDSVESKTWYFHLSLLFPLCLFNEAEWQAPQNLRNDLCNCKALSADLINYLVADGLRKMKGVADGSAKWFVDVSPS